MSDSFEPRDYRFKFVSVTPMLMHADDVEAADNLQDWRRDPANNELSKPGDDRSPPWTWRTYLYAGDIDGVRQIVIPSSNVMAALRYAGAQMTLKGNKTFKKLSQSGIAILDEFCKLRVSLGPVAYAPVINADYVKAAGLMPNDGESYDALAVRHAADLGVRVGDKHPGYGLRSILAEDIDAIPAMMKYRDQVLRCRKLGFNLFAKRAPVGKSKHVRCRPRFNEWEITGTFRVTQPAIDDKTLKTMFDIAGEQSGLGDWRPSSPLSPGAFGQFKVELQAV